MSYTLPRSNASLTKIAGSGFTEDYDQTPATDTTKWQGCADAYVTEKLRTVQGREQSQVVRTTIVIPLRAAKVGTLAAGDSLTYTYNGTSVTRTARDIRTHVLGKTVAVTLDDA